MRLLHWARAAVFLSSIPLFAANHSTMVFDGFVSRIGDGSIHVGDVAVFLDKATAPASFRIGERVHVTVKSEDGDTVQAAAIEERQTTPSREILNGDSLLSDSVDPPTLQKDGSGWSGSLYLGGFPVSVTGATKLSEPKGAAFSPDLLVPTTRVTYTTHRAIDGSVVADTLVFEAHPLSDKELKALKNCRAKVRPPEYVVKRDPDLQKELAKIRTKMEDPNYPADDPYLKLGVVNDERLQNYVTDLGNRLVPAWQRATTDKDREHVKFEFWVADGKMKADRVVNLGGGVIVVPLRVLMKLDNEAQLAAMLSAAISFELQRKLWDHRVALGFSDSSTMTAVELSILHPMTSPASLAGAVALHKYVNKLYDDAACEGMAYVIAAGYDPREAPMAYEWAAGKSSPGAFSPTEHMNDSVARLNAALSMQTVNFDTLKVGHEEIVAIQKYVGTLDKKMTRIK